MKLKDLSAGDKEIFANYLALNDRKLSVYAFENIYIWQGLFAISWAVIKDSLCIFFRDKIGCFLYIPPLAKKIEPEVIEEVFRIMDALSKNKDISRIENIEAKDLPFYQGLGYVCKYKSSDYLCKRRDLVQLRGDKFKSKRACFNYFIKHYESEYLPFSSEDKDACLRLYGLWMRERKNKFKDSVYQGMLEDSRICLKILLHNYEDLNCLGRIVKVNRVIKAFTFGFKLNRDTFCILYEIADLSIKGIAQFIFRRFCAELENYKYINIMDDSGLENLKEVKLSYQPIKLVPAYIVTRKNAEKFR